MIVIDTNVLIRLAVDDDLAQRTLVLGLVARHRCFLSRTVLLEADWVLRSLYSFSKSEVLHFFEMLVADENMVIEAKSDFLTAIERARAGLEFADAMHLAVSNGSPFYSFDRKLVKRARSMGVAAQLVTTAP